MGVPIGDLLISKERQLTDFSGKIIAIDMYNTLYQFLATIRQPDGTPLRDSKGRITSHLSGLLYRTVNIVSSGIRPVFVVDGKPPTLKKKTLEERSEIRATAREEWEMALKEGDFERARIKAQQSSILTKEMVEDAIRLLGYMGIPCVQAPSEGEAQAAYMAMRGDVYAAASQDYDSLLFGTPVLIRNLAVTGRRKLPKKDVYVEVSPEEIVLSESLSRLGISREQLVDIGILVGTDYNEGVKGVGIKTALELVKKYGSLEEIIKTKKYEIPNWREVREIFLNPAVTENYRLEWKALDEEAVIRFLCEERDFSEDRVKNALEKFKVMEKIRKQRSLDEWM